MVIIKWDVILNYAFLNLKYRYDQGSVRVRVQGILCRNHIFYMGLRGGNCARILFLPARDGS